MNEDATISSADPPLSDDVSVKTTGTQTILQAHATTEIGYPNYWVRDLFGADTTVAQLCAGRRIILYIDDGIYHDLHVGARAYLLRHGIQFEIRCGKSGERQKTLEHALEIVDTARARRLDRKGLLVAVGGGALMDVVGFAASIYRRGIGYVRVPTTLLGLIDAAIGIKVGVNKGTDKNILGSFFRPHAVVSDPGLLATLPVRQMRSGMGEMVKMGIVGQDPELFVDVERFGTRIVRNEEFPERQDIFLRAARSELELLQRDFCEGDLKRRVDFGHTFAHFFEGLTEYQLLHGEAVGIDILISSHVARERGLLQVELFRRIVSTIKTLGLPVYHDALTLENLWPAAVDAAVRHKGGELIMVLPRAIGEVEFANRLAASELEAALQFLKSIA